MKRPRRRSARVGAPGNASRYATAVNVSEVVQNCEGDELVARDPLALGLLVKRLPSEALERQGHAALGVLALSLARTRLAHLLTDRITAHSPTTLRDRHSLRGYSRANEACHAVSMSPLQFVALEPRCPDQMSRLRARAVLSTLGVRCRV